MFRVVVFDRNTFAVKGLTDTISDISDNFDVEYFSDEENALGFALSENIDLFIIRIYPVKNDAGYSFVKSLRKTKEYKVSFVVLLSSMDDEAMLNELYNELSCYKILSDPIDTKVFNQVLRTVSDYRIVRNDDIKVPFYIDGKCEQVRLSEMVWIGSDNGLVSLHMNDAKIFNSSIRNYSLDVLESTLSKDFIRIKRTTLVNKNYIEKVDLEKNLIKLKGIEMPFNIGITYVPQLRAQFEL